MKDIKVIITIGGAAYYPVKVDGMWMLDLTESYKITPTVPASQLTQIVASLAKFDYSLTIVHE